MQIVRTIAEMRAARSGLASPVGLVPTMGALHEGHLSLVARSSEQCATTIASLFVNPTQFGPNEDFERYPRDEERDLALFADAGVDLVFAPSLDEIYPAGLVTVVTLTGIAERLEGEYRPGHFDGVATVVTKLFNIVEPDRAYFGEKDAQQLRVIQALTRDLDLPIEIVGCTIIRESDGLALSSRNVYLSDEHRQQALSLSGGLRRAKAAFADGVRDADELRGMVRSGIEAQPLADIDYVSLADSGTLEELAGTVEDAVVLLLAVRFGATRLIDNTTLVP
jgi:pantoate--beta-alanine ligase